jgi:hypothetical protein
METDQGVITEQKDTMAHVVQFYKSLFAVEPSTSSYLAIFGSLIGKSRKRLKKA